MNKTKIFLTLFIAFTISFWSCQQSQTPLESDMASNSNELLKPQTLVSAVLKINVEHIAENTEQYPHYDLRIQKVSTPWEEMTATWELPWTNLGGDYYTPPEVAHFVYSETILLPGKEFLFDITELWKDGIPPYGIILRVENPAGKDKRIKFTSREKGTAAEVIVTYSKKNKLSHVSYPVIEDTWISNRIDPDDNDDWSDNNFGDYHYLYAGNIESEPNKEKRALLKFEIPPTYETAYGYDKDYAECFIDYGYGRWGWTNGELTAGSYEFELWAGAGQCDTEKGILVGSVTVDYDGSTATVTYNLIGGFTMNEVHLYAGAEQFPKDKKGHDTVAPGQYTVVNDNLGNAISHEVTVGGLSGPIYIIAHAVVCNAPDVINTY